MCFSGPSAGKNHDGRPVPEDFLQSLRPADFDDSWLGMARSIVLAGEADTVLQPVKAFADNCAAASLRDRVRYVLRTAFPSREHMARYMAEKSSLPLTPLREVHLLLDAGSGPAGKRRASAVALERAPP